MRAFRLFILFGFLPLLISTAMSFEKHFDYVLFKDHRNRYQVGTIVEKSLSLVKYYKIIDPYFSPMRKVWESHPSRLVLETKEFIKDRWLIKIGFEMPKEHGAFSSFYRAPQIKAVFANGSVLLTDNSLLSFSEYSKKVPPNRSLDDSSIGSISDGSNDQSTIDNDNTDDSNSSTQTSDSLQIEEFINLCNRVQNDECVTKMNDHESGKWRAKRYPEKPELLKAHTSGPSIVTVHWTATPLKKDKTGEQYIQNAYHWSVDHPDGPKWGDLPYHFYIDGQGKAWKGRSTKYMPDSNTRMTLDGQISIAVQGRKGDTFTIMQKKKLKSLVVALLKDYNLSEESLFTHRGLAHYHTECPGDQIIALIDELKVELKEARDLGLLD